MRTLITTVAALGILSVSSAAFAADATGSIKTLKPGMLTLSDGETFKIPSKVKTTGLKTGEKVTVTYAQSGKTKTVTALKIAG